jgi:hypothetical protein
MTVSRQSASYPVIVGRRAGGLEATSVDENDEGMRSRAGRYTQFAILTRVTAIGDAPIRRPARKRCQVLGRHQPLDSRALVRRRDRLSSATSGHHQQESG